MPYTIPKPEVQTFRLEQLDTRYEIPDDEKTTVSIRMATVAQNARRAELFGTYIREQADPERGRAERVIQEFHFYDLVALETFLTLVDCNLMNGEEPLFKFKVSKRGQYLAMTESEFNLAWGLLDDETAAEIHSKVLEVNKHWIFGAAENLDLGEG